MYCPHGGCHIYLLSYPRMRIAIITKHITSINYIVKTLMTLLNWNKTYLMFDE